MKIKIHGEEKERRKEKMKRIRKQGGRKQEKETEGKEE